MNNACKFERELESRNNRRLAREDRFLTRAERRDAAAEALVGELCRDGCAVFYLNLIDRKGRFTGKTREAVSQFELVQYALRNNYV